MSAITKIDPAILSFVPRSTYYLSLEENLASIEKQWSELFAFDRELFALLTLLPSSNYSKSRMIHYLLSNSINAIDKGNNYPTVLSFINPDIESKIILYNLRNMPMSAALRALLMLSGKDYGGNKLDRVNNTRARKIILNYIFDRTDSSLEVMVVKNKAKIAHLFKHVFGKDLHKILTLSKGHKKVLGKYCRDLSTGSLFDLNTFLSVVFFVFNNESFIFNNDFANSKTVKLYKRLRELSKKGDVDKFTDILNTGVLPYETVLGFRNFYKLDVELKAIHDKGKKSEKTKFRTLESSKRHGAEKVEVDFKKQSLKDLYKYVYLKQKDEGSLSGDDFSEIANIINEKLDKDTKFNIDLGKTVVIVDVSDSMRGHETRPYHPIITALLTANKFDYDVLMLSGGDYSGQLLAEPKGNTELWTALVDSAEQKPDTVVVISDGYENTIDGMFEHVYNTLKGMGYEFNVVHVNPVYDANAGGGKVLLEGTEPIAISEPEMFETNYILTQVGSDLENVKRLLINTYNKKVGGDKNELLDGGKV